MSDIAPDGSPVAFYRRLPPDGEPEIIAALVPHGATILDLGSGPGRIAGPLSERGLHVTAVDNGAAMVAALPEGIEGIVADARSLRLGRRFDAVLLMSHLLNDPHDALAFAATAAAHVDPSGIVIGKVLPPDYEPAARIGQVSASGEAFVELLRAEVRDGVMDAEVRYGVDGSEWRQAFTARILAQDALEALLREAGLSFTRWLDKPGWFVATLGGAGSGSHADGPSEAYPAG
jgi:SAM-dependent methyltransferase